MWRCVWITRVVLLAAIAASVSRGTGHFPLGGDRVAAGSPFTPSATTLGSGPDRVGVCPGTLDGYQRLLSGGFHAGLDVDSNQQLAPPRDVECRDGRPVSG